MVLMLIDGEVKSVDLVSSDPQIDPSKVNIDLYFYIGTGQYPKDFNKWNNPNDPNAWDEKLYHAWRRKS